LEPEKSSDIGIYHISLCYSLSKRRKFSKREIDRLEGYWNSTGKEIFEWEEAS